MTSDRWERVSAVLDTVLAADRTMPPVGALDGAVLLLETSEERPGEGEVRRMLLGLGERERRGEVYESPSEGSETAPAR